MKNKMVSIGIIIVAMLITMLGGASKVYKVVFYNNVQEGIVEYSSEKYEFSKNSFLLLSLVKGGLAMVEGSTLNVAVASIEVGDAIQAVYDTVDLLWQVTLATSVVYKINEMIFANMHDGLINLFVLTMLIFLLALQLMKFYKEGQGQATVKQYLLSTERIIKMFLRAVTTTFIFFFLIFPIVMVLSANVSKSLEKEFVSTSYSNVQASLDDLVEKQKELTSFRKTGLLEIGNNIGEFNSDLNELMSASQKTATTASEEVPTIIAFEVIANFVLPILLMVAVYRLFKVFIKIAFGDFQVGNSIRLESKTNQE